MSERGLVLFGRIQRKYGAAFLRLLGHDGAYFGARRGVFWGMMGRILGHDGAYFGA